MSTDRSSSEEGAVKGTNRPDAPSEITAPVERCDHICLLPASHVDEGRPHFYGYELPSPRQDAERPEIQAQYLVEVRLPRAGESYINALGTIITTAINHTTDPKPVIVSQARDEHTFVPGRYGKAS